MTDPLAAFAEYEEKSSNWKKELSQDPDVQAWYKQLRKEHPQEPLSIEKHFENQEKLFAGGKGSGYDYEGAFNAGIRPQIQSNGEWHWGSQDPETGRFLKGEKHPTYDLAVKEASKKDPLADFAEYEEKQGQTSSDESPARYAGQIGAGIAKSVTWPADLIKLAMQGASKEVLADLMENDPTINKEIAEQVIAKGMEYVPTQDLAEKLIEETTGLPLEPKTKGQKLLRLGVETAAFRPGSFRTKALAGISAPTISQIEQEGGVPEPLANLVGFVGGMSMPKAPEAPITGLKPEKTVIVPSREAPLPPGGEPPPPTGTPPPGIPPSPPLGGTPPPPSGETPRTGKTSDVSKILREIPSHVLVEEVYPILQAEKEARIPPKPKEIDFGVPPTEPIEMTHGTEQQRDLDLRIGRVVSPSAIPGPREASTAIRNDINAKQRTEYGNVDNLFATAREAQAGNMEPQPDMVRGLQALIDDISLAPEPSTVQKDIRKIARQFIRRGATFDRRGNVTGYRPISNQAIIAQRRAINQKIDHDYVQGRPSNAYIRLNQILDNAVETGSASNPESYEAYREAQIAYANHMQKYGNKDILPWRDPSINTFQKLYKSIQNSDELRILETILGDSQNGRALYDMLRRDFITKKLRSFVEDPTEINSLDFDDAMKEIRAITTPQERYQIEREFRNIADPIEEYARRKEIYDRAIEQRKRDIADYEKVMGQYYKNLKKQEKFPYKTEEAFLKDLNTVIGQKRIEKWLPKTNEGKASMDKIKDYAAMRLLTEGKIAEKDDVSSIRKTLYNIEKKALLEHALGKDIVSDLRDIVAKFPQIEKKAVETRKELVTAKRVLKGAKAGAKMAPLIGPWVARAEAIVELIDVLKPAVVEADFSYIDRETIRKLIENRKDLINLPPSPLNQLLR